MYILIGAGNNIAKIKILTAIAKKSAEDFDEQ